MFNTCMIYQFLQGVEFGFARVAGVLVLMDFRHMCHIYVDIICGEVTIVTCKYLLLKSFVFFEVVVKSVFTFKYFVTFLARKVFLPLLNF